jgi:type I restriction enzyme S subunit
MKMPRLATEDGKRAFFPLPPLAEQKAIVAKVEKLLDYVSELEEKIKQNKQDSEMLMQTFLAEAFKN